MRKFLMVLVALWSAPALADSCVYVADNGDRLQFTDEFINYDFNVRYWPHGGGEKLCLWLRSDAEPGLRVSCEAFDSLATFIGRGDRDIMVLDKRTWKQSCGENAPV